MPSFFVQILDEVGLIERPEKSEAVAYINKVLRENAGRSIEASLPGQPMNNENIRPSEQAGKGASVSSNLASNERRLGEIFKKISDKSLTKQVCFRYNFLRC